MTDIKRDFLYEFNQKVREIYSQSPSIVSVFENIDNGSLRLSPIELPDADFVPDTPRIEALIRQAAQLFDEFVELFPGTFNFCAVLLLQSTVEFHHGPIDRYAGITGSLLV